MSLDHTKLMLKTLKQYHKSEITLTFTNEEDVPVLSVSYLGNYFQVKNLSSSVVESYSELYPAVDYIEESLMLKTLI